jgi:hypothetical protein
MRRARLTWIGILAAALLAGCSSDLTEGLADAAPATQIDATPRPSAHTVYLAFDGLSLAPGPDNAANNTTTLLSAPYEVPALFPDDPQREVSLGLIADGIRELLAPYDVAIVTERPDSGDYIMIVFGGTSLDAGFENDFGAISPFVCNRDYSNAIAMAFERGSRTSYYTYVVVSELGILNGVPFSSVSGDCMCWSGASCAGTGDSVCTIGGAGTPVNTNDWPCEDITEMDEHQRFLGAFGAAP